ncbi:MAG: adenosylcobinamide-phosphate synthase CbiB [Rhodobacteraceae bacterium]|nr:adenosylcobinamide-phosphate synthase CbiB [Paracoccaceae bacterium]
MGSLILLLIALLLDALIGEPDYVWKRITHPVIAIGNLIHYFDTHFNTVEKVRLKGFLVLIGGCVGLALLGSIVYLLPLSSVLEILIVAILLAHRSLIDHVEHVAEALHLSLMEGRLAVSKIVGRDTSSMSTSDVSRAAIESTAESLMDGVIAPAFWYLIAGIPGILVYKFVNTADSMIGYQNEKYKEFGWATAKFDDLLNFIPARLTALIVSLVHFSIDAFQFARNEGNNHRSLNAGWPEAAFAKVMGVALSGPRVYEGTQINFPFINDEGRKELVPEDIEKGVEIAWRTWFGLCGLILLLEVIALRLV